MSAARAHDEETVRQTMVAGLAELSSPVAGLMRQRIESFSAVTLAPASLCFGLSTALGANPLQCQVTAASLAYLSVAFEALEAVAGLLQREHLPPGGANDLSLQLNAGDGLFSLSRSRLARDEGATAARVAGWLAELDDTSLDTAEELRSRQEEQGSPAPGRPATRLFDAAGRLAGMAGGMEGEALEKLVRFARALHTANSPNEQSVRDAIEGLIAAGMPRERTDALLRFAASVLEDESK